MLGAELMELVEWVQTTHHARTRRLLDEAAELLASDSDDPPASARPFLYTLHRTFARFRADLLAHLRTEEIAVFPYIVAIGGALTSGQEPKRTLFSSLASPLQLMRNEQEGTWRALLRLFRACTAAQSAGASSAALEAFEAKMRLLEADLERHVALETDVLFPAAIEVEHQLAMRVRLPSRLS